MKTSRKLKTKSDGKDKSKPYGLLQQGMTKIVSDFIHAYLNKPVYKIQRYGSNEINAVRIFRLS